MRHRQRAIIVATALACLAICVESCGTKRDIAFGEAKNYFFRNDASKPHDVRIVSQEQFDNLLGRAAFMGKNGEPTPIDFDREFVIAVVGDETRQQTELQAVRLTEQSDRLTLIYNKVVGEEQGWTMRPLLLIVVDKSHDKGKVELVEKPKRE